MSMYEASENNVNMNKIEEAKQNLDSSNITDDNYEDILRTRNGHIDIILAQLENERIEFDDADNSYKEMLQTDQFKTAVDNGVVPVDVFKQLIKVLRVYRNIVNWGNTKMNYDDIVLKKLHTYINDINKKKLVRDTFTAMNDERKQMHEFLKNTFEEKDVLLRDTINTKIANTESALDNRIKNIEMNLNQVQQRMFQQQIKDRQEMIDLIKVLLDNLGSTKEIREVKEVIDEAQEKGVRFKLGKDKKLKTTNDSVSNDDYDVIDYAEKYEKPEQKPRPKPQPTIIADDEDDEEYSSFDDVDDDDDEEKPKPKSSNKTIDQIEKDFSDFEV